MREMAAHSDDAARALSEHRWLERVAAVPVPPKVAAWDLGAGEEAVLSHATCRPGCIAVLDDYAARTCAKALGVPVVGTLGLALSARRSGRVASARALIEELRQAGLYLSEHLVRDALALVGE